MFNIKPIILTDSDVQLEPLNESHQNELFQAAQNENIWVYNSSKAFGEKFYPWFEKAVNAFQLRQQFPFIVRRLSDQQIIGSTRYYDINDEHRRLTIGYTWYIPEVWGSYVNPTCKFLLLKCAFEKLQMNRVEFVTDSRNARSRAAIKKLGATEEGVLRQHMVLEDGFVRDTVVFSIVKSDWLHIKSILHARLKIFENGN
ncbi:MAG: hypothetical protein ACD_46C00535G0004 [uncultured bacterium]|nr:MAG: hypothetical protein ACD_46C00535G0004 [uncultured bacterium]